MYQIFPAIEPFHSQMIEVSGNQQIYLEQIGDPDGIPVLYLHGGPGGGISETSKRIFDPDVYRIITFDQRGCGKSLPFATLEDNTTAHLLQDIEQIRQLLGIEKWVVAGGSWGTTLALVYAIEYAQRVSALLLRGIFLARQQDFDWFLEPQGGAAQLFPDHYRTFLQPVRHKTPETSICQAYYQIFTQTDEITRVAAAKAWSQWEASIACLQAKHFEHNSTSNMSTVVSLAILECHYILNQCFIEPDYIINNMDKISHIPATLIHGRYDTVCKMEGAYELDRHWPNSQLLIVPAAGHSETEPAIADALCKSSNAIAQFLQEKCL